MFFKKENWNRFFTHDKKTTIRFDKKRAGIQAAGRGSKICGTYKHLGKVEVGEAIEPDGKMIKELTEQDAKDDGFDTLKELIDELTRINYGKEITPERRVWRHPVKILEGNPCE